MKRYLLSLCFTLLVISSVFAQDTPTQSDSTGQLILKELQTIRGLQKESRDQRQRAVEKRQRRDSLLNKKSDEDLSTDYGVMAKIEDNTRQHPMTDGWNFYGISAFIIALASAVIALITLREQSKTEKHTQKAPKDAQLGVLKDLPRHFYRNLACTCAAHYSFRSQKTRLKYPSEANILKLTTLPDEFILPIDLSSDIEYKKMHEEKLLFRNYNLEVEVAAKHYAVKNITDNSLKNDYDNLLFKPLFLTTHMLELQDLITSDGKSDAENGVVYAIYAFVKEHFEKLSFKPFIENNHNEIALLNGIAKDGDFEKMIGEKDDSISRSLKMLLKYKKTDKDTVEFLSRSERNKNGEFEGKGEVLLGTEKGFIAFFKKYYSKESLNSGTKGLDNFEKVLSIRNEEDFINCFNDCKQSEDASKAFSALSFYFKLMNDDKWDVKDLLYTILKVDTVLEISKIGMIDYQ